MLLHVITIEIFFSLLFITGSYLYSTEDSLGWVGALVHMSDIWKIFSCCYDFSKYSNKFFVLHTGKYWSSIWYWWCVSDNLPFINTIKYFFQCFDYALWKTIIFHSPLISNFIRGKWCYTCLKRCLPGYWNMLSGAIWGCLTTQGQWWHLGLINGYCHSWHSKYTGLKDLAITEF